MEEKISAWEKHGQSLVAALILTGIFYIASQTVEAAKNIEVLNVKVESLNKSLEIAASDRYTSRDAKADLLSRDQRIDHLKQRLEAHELRLTRIENKS